MPHVRSISIAARIRRQAAPLAVLGGGLVGSAARSSALLFADSAGSRFPAVTLGVNLTGSFLLALYLARRQRSVSSTWSLHFWAIGVFGSFTTFSAFSLEVFHLVDAGAALVAGYYVAASTIGGLAAAVVGGRIGRTAR